MNFIININICRVCMKSDEGISITSDSDIKMKFTFATRLKIDDGDNLPQLICGKCLKRLKISYEFIQQALLTEKKLKSFLAKINNDFELVTANDSVYQMDDDLENEVLALIDESEEGEQQEEEQMTSSTVNIDKNYIQSSTSDKYENKGQASNNFKMEIVENEIFDKILVQSEDKGQHHNLDDRIKEQPDHMSSLDIGEITSVTSPPVIENLTEDKFVGKMDSKMELIDANPMQMQELYFYENVDDGTNSATEKIIVEPDDMDETEVFSLEEDTSSTRHSTYELELHPEPTAMTSMKPETKKRSKTPRKPQNAISKSVKLSSGSIGSLEARYVCDKCDRDFSTKTNLTRHLASHDGVKPFQCKECNKQFTQNGSLKQHMYTHTGEKPYVCDICDRGFTQCKSLVFHMRRHSGEKPFFCELCALNFRHKDGLKAHILKHHMTCKSSNYSEVYICEICNKELPDRSSMQTHTRQHVNQKANNTGEDQTIAMDDQSSDIYMEIVNEEDLLPNKATFTNDDLALSLDEMSDSAQVVDVLTTSAAQPSRAKKYQCRKCYKSFAIKQNLIRHLTIHNYRSNDDVEEVYQCQSCNQTFDSDEAMKHHCDAEHKVDLLGGYECEDCQMEFQNEEELNEHIQTTHDLSDQQGLMDQMLQQELNDGEDNN